MIQFLTSFPISHKMALLVFQDQICLPFLGEVANIGQKTDKGFEDSWKSERGLLPMIYTHDSLAPLLPPETSVAHF